MPAPYKFKIIVSAFVCFTIIVLYAGAKVSQVEDVLLPKPASVFPWSTFPGSDGIQGGESTIELREDTYHLSFDFELLGDYEYPYAALGLMFDDGQFPSGLVDWSQYSYLALRIKCRPANELTFILHTFEDQITQHSDITTYRNPQSFFSCNDQWQDLELSLHQLVTPDWWLQSHGLNLSNQKYDLSRVRALSFASSSQSPVALSSTVIVESMALKGRNWAVAGGSLAIIIVVWGSFVYLSRVYWMGLSESVGDNNVSPVSGGADKGNSQSNCLSDSISEPISNPLPVTLDSKRDREKTSLIEYLSKEYVNSELSLEGVAQTLGINRTKINTILRESTGLTFSAYINKLRLTEASRLLTEKQLGVTETAYAVGYGSVSYFNRAFKKEFGCAPSTYKKAESISKKPPV